ncbi:MAG TPA: HAD family hydrolase [Terriglobales bacterium]|nr:HAD family hydrolase [Terriglobales bacterium]
MIFFDIDGTLIDHASASAGAAAIFFDKNAGKIPFAREHFPATWEEILNKHFDRFCRGEISLWEQRRARMRDVFGAPGMSDAEADAYYQKFVREYEKLTSAYDDAGPCLERLAGESLGIISNGAREQQIGKLQRAGLLKYFSVMVYSEDVGLGKPAPSIFLEACRRAGDAPEQCVHIGDNIDADVIPSRALGMRGIHLNRPGLATVEPPTIVSLRNLPALIN